MNHQHFGPLSAVIYINNLQTYLEVDASMLHRTQQPRAVAPALSLLERPAPRPDKVQRRHQRVGRRHVSRSGGGGRDDPGHQAAGDAWEVLVRELACCSVPRRVHVPRRGVQHGESRRPVLLCEGLDFGGLESWNHDHLNRMRMQGTSGCVIAQCIPTLRHSRAFRSKHTHFQWKWLRIMGCKGGGGQQRFFSGALHTDLEAPMGTESGSLIAIKIEFQVPEQHVKTLC